MEIIGGCILDSKLQQMIDKHKIVIIDGSMGTALEHLGADLNDKLWTAKVLAETPDLVKEVHLNYFKAGADVGITCSYQATIPGLREAGYSQREAEQLICRSVEIFKEAREEWWQSEGKKENRLWPLCLAGIGPYGAYLADGSEYTGNYTLSDEELYDFHYRRMELLWASGADVLLIETQPSLREALVEAQIAEELNAPYWISFSCADEHHINEGTPIRECAKEVLKGHPLLQAIGVNCTKPEFVASLVTDLVANTDLPVFCYPNSGEEYDATTKTWHGTASTKGFGDYALEYMLAGASAVGGCCTTVTEHIRQVVNAREEYLRTHS